MNPPRIGTLPAGPRDAISDVGEIRVGHVTLDLGAIQQSTPWRESARSTCSATSYLLE